MNRLLYFALILFFACENKTPTGHSLVKDDTDFYSNIDKVPIERALTIQRIKKGTEGHPYHLAEKNYANEEDGKIIIKSTEGHELIAIPKETHYDESTQIYSYVGLNTDIDYHMVKYSHHQGNYYYILIGDKEGDVINLYSKPIITSFGMMLDIHPNVMDEMTYFRIFKKKNNKLELVQDLSFDTWIADFDNTTYQITADDEIIIPFWTSTKTWDETTKSSKDYLLIEFKKEGK